MKDVYLASRERAAGETDKRGWWGDVLTEFPNDITGSRLWLLKREKQTEETRRRAAEFAAEALAWMIDDGIAQTIGVTAEWLGLGFLGLSVTIQRPQGQLTFTYRVNWIAEAVEINGLY